VLRYETALERSLYKALHELQRLQAARAGVPVPPPAAADVDVTVMAPREEEGAGSWLCLAKKPDKPGKNSPMVRQGYCAASLRGMHAF